MRTVIASLLIAGLLVVLGAGAIIYAGVYDVAATTLDWPVARAIIETARVHSIKAHAAGIAVPPGLDDPGEVLIGVVYQGKFGQTANFARQAGESTSDVRFVFGIRTWF